MFVPCKGFRYKADNFGFTLWISLLNLYWSSTCCLSMWTNILPSVLFHVIAGSFTLLVHWFVLYYLDPNVLTEKKKLLKITEQDLDFPICYRHLIGFFLFLALTIYTATKVPKVVDLHSLQTLPDVLRKTDLHKLQAELLTCLPSLPHMPDFHKLRDGLLRSPSNWHIIDLLTNCLPERFSRSNHTDVCVLVRILI